MSYVQVARVLRSGPPSSTLGTRDLGVHVTWEVARPGGTPDGEDDRFRGWGDRVDRSLFPLGELDHGRFFLGITGERVDI